MQLRRSLISEDDVHQCMTRMIAGPGRLAEWDGLLGDESLGLQLHSTGRKEIAGQVMLCLLASGNTCVGLSICVVMSAL